MIINQTFDEERALYGSQNIVVKDCAFDGSADGESAFKESREVAVGYAHSASYQYQKSTGRPYLCTGSWGGHKGY